MYEVKVLNDSGVWFTDMTGSETNCVHRAKFLIPRVHAVQVLDRRTGARVPLEGA